MLAVCMPSRSLIHSRTMESVLDNLVGYDFRFCFAHGLPIPDCHNYIIEKALELKPELIWMLEDDQWIPPGTLDSMVHELTDHEIIVADYPVGIDGNQHCVHIANGYFIWAGLGCVLMRPSVLEKLDRPYFRTDTSYQLEGEKVIKVKPMGNHGVDDVDFWQRLMEKGVHPVISRQTIGHIQLVEPAMPKWGNSSANAYKVKIHQL